MAAWGISSATPSSSELSELLEESLGGTTELPGLCISTERLLIILQIIEKNVDGQCGVVAWSK